jgi:transcriptional regulator with XRE-family HTH domain
MPFKKLPLTQGSIYADLTAMIYNPEEEYPLVREMLSARSKSALTQEAVAELMGTTKSAVSRLESAGKHAPSLTTLKKYAQAIGCDLKIKFIPKSAPARHAAETIKKRPV